MGHRLQGGRSRAGCPQPKSVRQKCPGEDGATRAVTLGDWSRLLQRWLPGHAQRGPNGSSTLNAQISTLPYFFANTSRNLGMK
jgi:hypothetical protein